jgi:hypothetical protein
MIKDPYASINEDDIIAEGDELIVVIHQANEVFKKRAAGEKAKEKVHSCIHGVPVSGGTVCTDCKKITRDV